MASRARAVLGRVAAVFSGLSLRTRLLVGLVLVALVGVIAANVVVYAEVEANLVGQVQSQLTSLSSTYERSLLEFGGLNDRDPGISGAPLGTFFYFLGPNGVVASYSGKVVEQLGGSGPPSPVLPGRLYVADKSATAGRFLSTTGRNDASLGYELYARPSHAFPNVVLVVATPLSKVASTMHHLFLIDLAVTLGVVVVLAALGLVVVRIGMAPLVAIEATAQRIAAGDLSERVSVDNPGTEVGRLGGALNVMLGRIEHAFSEQRASEQRLRQFLSDASHELRTPVTSIRGYSELFRRGAADRPLDLEVAMRRIEEEASRMGVLVDDLLLLARLDEGRPLEAERFDLSALAKDATADAEVTAPERQISIDAPEPVVIVGDEQRIRQVVANLLQNALRHTEPDAAIEVTVASEGRLARLSVRDEGAGIAPEHAARVFERFYRSDPSRTRGSGGSGLGLSIVSSIAEAHKGRAFVVSAPGAGSTFTVELPLADDAALLRPPASSGDEPKPFA